MPRKNPPEVAVIDIDKLVPPPAPSPIVQALRKDWRWAGISQFLFTFSDAFGMVDWDIEALEADFDGDEQAVIPDVIVKHLFALTYDRKISRSNVFESLRKQYSQRRPRRNPLGTEQAPIEWGQLGLGVKVGILWQLCEWQMEDPARFRGLLKSEEEAGSWRIDPVGWDKSGNTYFLFDDNRLWVQRARPRPPSPSPQPEPKKAASKSKKGAKKGKGRASTSEPSSAKRSHKKRPRAEMNGDGHGDGDVDGEDDDLTPPPAETATLKAGEPVSGTRTRKQVSFYGNPTSTVQALKRGGPSHSSTSTPNSAGKNTRSSRSSGLQQALQELPTPTRPSRSSRSSGPLQPLELAPAAEGTPLSRGTRATRRNRDAEDEWQQIPPEWLDGSGAAAASSASLANGDGKGKSKVKGKGKGKAITAAKAGDDSDLSDLTDEEEHAAMLSKAGLAAEQVEAIVGRGKRRRTTRGSLKGPREEVASPAPAGDELAAESTSAPKVDIAAADANADIANEEAPEAGAEPATEADVDMDAQAAQPTDVAETAKTPSSAEAAPEAPTEAESEAAALAAPSPKASSPPASNSAEAAPDQNGEDASERTLIEDEQEEGQKAAEPAASAVEAAAEGSKTAADAADEVTAPVSNSGPSGVDAAQQALEVDVNATNGSADAAQLPAEDQAEVDPQPALADDVKADEGNATAKLEETAEAVKEEPMKEESEEEFDENDEVQVAAREDANPPEGLVEWEAVCVTLYDWRTFPEQFAKSWDPDEQNLYVFLTEEAGPQVLEALIAKEQERIKQAAINNRKRSSRIATKELEKEELERRAAAQAEMEDRMEKMRREEKRAKFEAADAKAKEEARESRLREREERLNARERAIIEKEEEEIREKERKDKARERRQRKRDGEVVSGSEDEHESTRAGTGTPAVLPESAGTGVKPAGIAKRPPGRPRKSKDKANGKAEKQDDGWELNCEICRKSGWNLDDDSDVVCCDGCGRWQHVECHDRKDSLEGRRQRDWDRVDFKCKDCRHKAARHRERAEQVQREGMARASAVLNGHTSMPSAAGFGHNLPPSEQRAAAGAGSSPERRMSVQHPPQPHQQAHPGGQNGVQGRTVYHHNGAQMQHQQQQQGPPYNGDRRMSYGQQASPGNQHAQPPQHPQQGRAQSATNQSPYSAAHPGQPYQSPHSASPRPPTPTYPNPSHSPIAHHANGSHPAYPAQAQGHSSPARTPANPMNAQVYPPQAQQAGPAHFQQPAQYPPGHAHQQPLHPAYLQHLQQLQQAPTQPQYHQPSPAYGVPQAQHYAQQAGQAVQQPAVYPYPHHAEQHRQGPQQSRLMQPQRPAQGLGQPQRQYQPHQQYQQHPAADHPINAHGQQHPSQHPAGVQDPRYTQYAGPPPQR